MNKSTKIWVNNVLGAVISIVLLSVIYIRIRKQLPVIDAGIWHHTTYRGYLYAALFLMLVNSFLEGTKWYMLLRSIAPVRYTKAFASYLAGIAFSIVTPNRIGEYPGRLLYMGRRHTFSYITMAVLGIGTQLWAIYIYGIVGLCYFLYHFPSAGAGIVLAACIIINILFLFISFRFGSWLSWFRRYKCWRRISVYGRLLLRISSARKLQVFGISLLRFAVFTAQYLFLLKWLNISIPIVGGFCVAALFFWILAVVPSLALTELGVRGTVSLYLFGHFSGNSVSILTATVILWMLNLILPSILGSILIWRMKLLRE